MTGADQEDLGDGPSIADPCLGFPGPAEPLPPDDADQDEPTMVNEDEVSGDG